ncbi:VapC toxin family PIN domain ribonuclease [Neoaquamicrobium sediminum]|nr:VapC toxin family PIN domain ribonuclease [Mesorhizobium sediminum]
MSERADTELFIASLTLAAIQRGIPEKPVSKKRRDLEASFLGPEGPQVLFKDRIFLFNEDAGLIWARLMADGKASGRPRSALDTIIAAIGEANGCVVVTDNEKDFSGVEIINPMRATT